MHYYRFAMGLFAAIGLHSLVACASLDNMFERKEDPEVLEVKQELDLLRESLDTVKKNLEDTNHQLLELKAKSEEHGKLLQRAVEPDQSQVPFPIPAAQPPVNREEAIEQQTPTRVETQAAEETSIPEPERPAQAPETRALKTVSEQDPQSLYQEALEAYKKSLYEQAENLFKTFLERYPQHNLADNAQYWLGEIYYDLENYSEAISAFRLVMVRYPESDKVPAALLKIGFSYIELDDLQNGRFFLEKVLKNYPASDPQAKAKLRLREIEASSNAVVPGEEPRTDD